ncbi:D-ribose ABC transporter substrate-binding protein [Cryobacterium levicorallinum]|uniref:D-ribose ABC transporter substrate-binding protein n=1 Tax=Cryobacterium levicorallinum TaxID=995038 RepID=A0A1I3CQ40_9MICO|nr:substrate-binding domain-containing protein [Cryobacterium levicorallinum]TFB87854.1 D-ribose ABC transporter substrate-binding protein [Cryobacterium levicorallinum]GEP27829.1 D-ribose ABC transporter substrate-binding protein [Cryobacterium levicorallinum]SFH76607.1 ribose transport system substrate-binding protein [Cryobacterium levicorallinum]
MKSSSFLKIAALTATAALILAGTTACGRGGAEASGDKIVLAISTLNNPFFVELRDGAEAAAAEAGVELSIVDAQNDSATQANQLATAASSGAQAVIINPVDSDAAASAVGDLITAGIPVIGVDRTVTGVDLASLVASDNVAGGRQAADELAKAMGEAGTVIHLQGVAGTSASRERGAGFEEGMLAYPGITVVATQTANFDRAAALDVTTNLLQSNPGVTGLFAENDEMALGAIQALGAKAGTEVFVVGFDGTADGLAAIEAGTLVATIAQQPAELGKLAIEFAVKAIKGEAIETTVPVEVVSVTKTNVGDFTK